MQAQEMVAGVYLWYSFSSLALSLSVQVWEESIIFCRSSSRRPSISSLLAWVRHSTSPLQRLTLKQCFGAHNLIRLI